MYTKNLLYIEFVILLMNNKQNSLVIVALITASMLGLLGVASIGDHPLADLQKVFAEMCSKCIFTDDEGECFGSGC
jgi:hypothetical protein